MIDQPSAEQCATNAVLPDDGLALWFPQIGGYAAKAVAYKDSEADLDGCVDLYVWHDGNFPFDDDRNPAQLHLCSPSDFIRLGKTLAEWVPR